MVGAILGDIAGSWIEYGKPKGFDYKNIEIFNDECYFTDDTVMTIATKYAIDNNISFAKAYQKFGRKYPDAGYGNMFDNWIRSNNPKPYNSFGNGSAMRVSYIGEFFNNLQEVEKFAIKSAECTHNHTEGIKGAVAIATCIYMVRKGFKKDKLKQYIQGLGYTLDKSLDEIRATYRYDITCQGTVPVAIQCFLESKDYESCIRNVFSLTCDTDTMACIAGGIAENFYKTTGFDNSDLLNRFLDSYLLNIIA